MNDLEGFCADIFRKFHHLCPIHYRLHKNGDGLWGNFVDRNGKACDLNATDCKWNGMVGQLFEKKADMGRHWANIVTYINGD